MGASDDLVRLLDAWCNGVTSFPFDPETGHATTSADMAKKILGEHEREVRERVAGEIAADHERICVPAGAPCTCLGAANIARGEA